jgi:hypothetical protein
MKIKNFIAIAVLVTAILGFGQNASAVTIEELLAQIAQLQAQIVAMQAQQQTQTQTQTWCHTFNTNMGYGATGSDFEALITVLEKEGILEFNYENKPSAYDEVIGSAIVEFQEKYVSEILTPYGLKRGTGYVGKSTRAKLNKIYGCGTTPVCTPSWTCSSWSTCSNNQQARTCWDPNSCGVTTDKPATTQTCGTAQPSITVNSPNEGETWKIGSLQKVSWTSNNIPTSNMTEVSLIDSNDNLAINLTTVANQNGQAYFIVPSTVSAGQYKVHIKTVVNGVSYIDISNSYITVASATSTCTPSWICNSWSTCANGQQTRTCSDENNCGVLTYKPATTQTCSSSTPFIVVTYPLGNEMLTKGTAVYIKWQSSGFLANDKLDITLYKGDSHNGYIAKGIPVSQGYYYWTVSETVSSWGLGLNNQKNGIILAAAPLSELYKIQIAAYTNTGSVLAESGYFGIKLTPNPVCVDSDGGRNYYVKGKIDYTTIAGVTGSISDECYDGQYLQEFYCDVSSGDNYKYEKYACPNGCLNGACVQATTPSITVTSPNGGEVWKVGETHNITWNSAFISSDANVSIQLSYILNNNSSPYESLIFPIGINTIKNTGNYSWLIPTGSFNSFTWTNMQNGKYLIRLIYSDPATGKVLAQDYSDNYFTIASASTQPSITVTSVGGSDIPGHNLTFFWTASGVSAVDLILENSSKTYTLATGVPANNGSYSVRIPGDAVLGTYYMIVKSGSTVAYGEKFSIVAPAAATITVTSPNGGELWIVDNLQTIRFINTGVTGSAWIYLDKYSGSTRTKSFLVGVFPLSISKQSEVHSFNLSRSLINSMGGPGNFKIRVVSNASGTPQDTSDNYFTVADPLASSDISQSSLASISDAVSKLAEQIKSLLSR